MVMLSLAVSATTPPSLSGRQTGLAQGINRSIYTPANGNGAGNSEPLAIAPFATYL